MRGVLAITLRGPPPHAPISLYFLSDDVTSPPLYVYLPPSSQCRLGQAEDIAGVASFLCSDDARYITGETIVAAGGLQSR